VRPEEHTIFSIKITEGKAVATIIPIQSEFNSTTIRGNFFDPVLGYKLFPYFGGTPTAPHDMSITLTQKMDNYADGKYFARR
jgi:hypothetical protein